MWEMAGRGDWATASRSSSTCRKPADFVFSVLAEELGMVGALLTVALFVFVGVRALYIGLWAEKAKQFYSAYVAYGTALRRMVDSHRLSVCFWSAAGLGPC